MSAVQGVIDQLKNFHCEAEFWDVRIEDEVVTKISFLDGEETGCSVTPSLGAFVRMRKNGFWYYQSTTEIQDIPQILKRFSLEAHSTIASTPFRVDPHGEHTLLLEQTYKDVDIVQKTELAQKFSAILAVSPLVHTSQILYKDVFKRKTYINNAQTKYVYDLSSGGFRINYTCVDGKFRFEDQYQIYGSQFSELPHRLSEFENYLSESRRFLHAPVLAPGHYKVIFKPEVTGVFTHESFGHKSEADFYIGNEDSLKEWEIGKVIAAKGLNIVDSGAHPGTSGYCPFDDDGMPAQKTYLIKDGRLAGRLHSLETAMLLNERPTGNSRALNFEFEPIVRMTSTYIEPGDRDLADIIGANAGAILVEGYKHGSGDSTFTIAPVRGYQVDEHGGLQPVRVMCISGSVLATLKNVKAISKDFDLYNTSIGGCGKMGQMPLPVAFGGPYILVEGMMVS